jgi:hypothetical protein
MTGFRFLMLSIVGVVGLTIFAPSSAQAQFPVAVPTWQPAAVPVVTYLPERRGLFGLQTVYRPVVTFASPVVTAPAPVVVASPVIQAHHLAPAPAPVTTFYAPAPVTTFRVPAPVLTAPAPVLMAPAPVLTAPAPVTVLSPPVQVFSPVLPVIIQ